MAHKKDSSGSRTTLAITLIIASFLSALFLASFSNRTDDYWVVTKELTIGHQLVIGDLSPGHVNLGGSKEMYIPIDEDPIGMIASSKLQPGQLLSRNSVSMSAALLVSSAVPLSIRTSDIAAGIQVGEQVDIYWVIDAQNGEIPTEPMMILGGITLLSLDEKSKNFGTDASLTVAIEETQVLHLLRATTHGRLVVVRTHV